MVSAMKKLSVATALLFVFGAALFAQDRARDEAAINKQIDAMVASWNNHNYDNMKDYATDDTDWVNVVGMWWKGRKQSQYAHQIYHNTIFTTSVCQKTSAAIRFVTKDVAIVHLFWHFSDTREVTLPDGKKAGPNDDLATLVYVKQNGKWLMTAGENVHVDKGAQQFDPVNQMPRQ